MFNDISKDTLCIIASKLRFRDLSEFSKTCTILNALTKLEAFWKQYIFEQYGICKPIPQLTYFKTVQRIREILVEFKETKIYPTKLAFQTLLTFTEEEIDKKVGNIYSPGFPQLLSVLNILRRIEYHGEPSSKICKICKRRLEKSLSQEKCFICLSLEEKHIEPYIIEHDSISEYNEHEYTKSEIEFMKMLGNKTSCNTELVHLDGIINIPFDIDMFDLIYNAQQIHCKYDGKTDMFLSYVSDLYSSKITLLKIQYLC